MSKVKTKIPSGSLTLLTKPNAAESAQYICAITSVVTLRNLPTSGSIKRIGTVKDNV